MSFCICFCSSFFLNEGRQFAAQKRKWHDLNCKCLLQPLFPQYFLGWLVTWMLSAFQLRCIALSHKHLDTQLTSSLSPCLIVKVTECEKKYIRKIRLHFNIECSFVTIDHFSLQISVFLNTEQIWEFAMMLWPLSWNLWSRTGSSTYYEPGILTNKFFKMHCILSSQWKNEGRGYIDFINMISCLLYDPILHVGPPERTVFLCLKEWKK